MQGRGIVVSVPPEAQARLDELSILRDSALDASRACQQRMNMLPDDADQLAIKLAAERDKHAQQHNILHRLLSAINQALFQMRLPPGYILEPAPPIAIELRKGQTIFELIEAVRCEISAINRQMTLVRSAPLRKQSMREELTRYLASHAMRVRPRVSFQQGNAKVHWDEDTVHSKDDVLGLLSWFMGGPQELAVAFGIEQEPEPPDALTPDERATQLSKLADDLLALERREAALLNGVDGILPRPEMNPLAYLQVRITMEAQAKVA
jgi:hypothetical protein